MPSETKVIDFVNQAAAAKPDARGLIWITGSSVLLPGDSLSIWVDAATLQTRKTQVNTFYEREAVNLTATFKTLPSGLTYAAFTQVNIPGKQFSVQIQNYDYNRTVAAPSPAASAVPIGTVVQALPAGCVSVAVSGVAYYDCGGTFYKAAFQGNNLVYVVVQNPL